MLRLRHVVAFRFGGMAIGSLVQALTYVLLARAFGADGFGVFAALIAIGGLVCSVLGFGFSPLALRTPAGPEGDRTRAAIVFVRCAVIALIIASFAVAAAMLALPPEVVTVACAFTIVDGLTDAVQAALAGLRRIGVATAILLGQRAAMLAVVIVSVATQAWGWVFVNALAIALANAVVVVRTWPRWRRIPQLVAASRGYWATNLSSSLSQLESPIVAILGGAAMAGVYGASARASGPVTLVAQSLMQVSTPELTVADPVGRRRLFSRLWRATWVLVAGCLLVCFPAGLLGSWILGPGYEGAAPIIAGFVVGAGIMACNQVHQAMLLALGRPALAAQAIAVGALTGLVIAGALSALGEPALLGVVPPLTQGTMLVLFRRAVGRQLSVDGAGADA